MTAKREKQSVSDRISAMTREEFGAGTAEDIFYQRENDTFGKTLRRELARLDPRFEGITIWVGKFGRRGIDTYSKRLWNSLADEKEWAIGMSPLCARIYALVLTDERFAEMRQGIRRDLFHEFGHRAIFELVHGTKTGDDAALGKLLRAYPHIKLGEDAQAEAAADFYSMEMVPDPIEALAGSIAIDMLAGEALFLTAHEPSTSLEERVRGEVGGWFDRYYDGMGLRYRGDAMQKKVEMAVNSVLEHLDEGALREVLRIYKDLEVDRRAAKGRAMLRKQDISIS